MVGWGKTSKNKSQLYSEIKTFGITKLRDGRLGGRNFGLLLFSSIFSSLSISMYLTVEQWYVVHELGMSQAVGWVLMATSLPRVLFMMMGGAAADRQSRTMMILLSLSGRCFVLFTMAGLLAVDQLHLVILCACAALFGISDAFFWPARDSLIPQLVNPDRLASANAMMQTSNQISTMLGPLLSAVLLSAFSYITIVLILAFMLITAGFCVYRIQDKQKRPVYTADHPGAGIFRQLQEGFRYVASSSLLRTIMGTFTVVNLFFVGPLMISIPLLANARMGGSAVSLSVMQGAFAMGSLAGAAVMGLVRLTRRGIWVTGCIALEGVLLILYSLSDRLPLSAALLALLGSCVSFINIPVISLVQESAPAHMLGRIVSLNTMVSMGLIPISYGLVSFLLTLKVGIQPMLVTGGVAVIGLAVYLAVKAGALRSI
ncbi:MFS transporter [Paenibacillus sp. JX-17]|uniref:MFS transporter n=1 Tax=Paenibacillus lacisoli TaxID=3064525 RepID=A0ABT9C9Y8_9BACL|nr:MFS transporter [Paenibacillus sp. JX-17]